VNAWRRAGRAAGDAPVWIFDLDNTLHDADPHIFPHLNRAQRAASSAK
jgi:putative hydrolase of the HAD superfamily